MEATLFVLSSKSMQIRTCGMSGKMYILPTNLTRISIGRNKNSSGAEDGSMRTIKTDNRQADMNAACLLFCIIGLSRGAEDSC
jgi:hypothetical protein